MTKRVHKKKHTSRRVKQRGGAPYEITSVEKLEEFIENPRHPERTGSTFNGRQPRNAWGLYHGRHTSGLFRSSYEWLEPLIEGNIDTLERFKDIIIPFLQKNNYYNKEYVVRIFRDNKADEGSKLDSGKIYIPPREESDKPEITKEREDIRAFDEERKKLIKDYKEMEKQAAENREGEFRETEPARHDSVGGKTRRKRKSRKSRKSRKNHKH
jgi:hypothetical protein